MIANYMTIEHVTMTWERFTTMFRDEFVLAVERERLAQELLSLKHKIETVTEITMMFHERDLFFPEQVLLEQARVAWYLSVLRRDIIVTTRNSNASENIINDNICN